MKKSIEKILIKNFPRLKNTKISKNIDLIKNGIIDSLELMKLISYLKKNINLILTYQKKIKISKLVV